MEERYYMFENGLYFFKYNTEEHSFYLLDDNMEWKFCPSLMDTFYDAASDYSEISKEEMDAYIKCKKIPASCNKSIAFGNTIRSQSGVPAGKNNEEKPKSQEVKFEANRGIAQIREKLDDGTIPKEIILEYYGETDQNLIDKHSSLACESNFHPIKYDEIITRKHPTVIKSLLVFQINDKTNEEISKYNRVNEEILYLIVGYLPAGKDIADCYYKAILFINDVVAPETGRSAPVYYHIYDIYDDADEYSFNFIKNNIEGEIKINLCMDYLQLILKKPTPETEKLFDQLAISLYMKLYSLS